VDAIKVEPTPGLTYNPNESGYWDRRAMEAEQERLFEICRGCRLCQPLCPTFPALFQAVDRHGEDVRRLSMDERERIVDLCYQCKLCSVRCPYSPEEGHPFQVDFPRMMLRSNAVRKKEQGIGLRGWMLSRPELAGSLGGLTAGWANGRTRRRLLRMGLERMIGIHRDKQLPEFHGETFEEWYRNRGSRGGDAGHAVLFHTCFVNHNDPRIGKDTVEVFERNGIALGCSKQNCCGMPALEAGDIALAKRNAEANVASLLPHVEAGRKILAINPTCSYMVKKEYPQLVGTPAASAVAGASMDVCEFLWQRRQEGSLNRDFRSTPGRVAYHVPCHLKAQNIGSVHGT